MHFDFIVPTGRGGSLLLQSLFDGHPEAVVLPGYFSGYETKTEFRGVTPEILASKYSGPLGTTAMEEGGPSSSVLRAGSARYAREVGRALESTVKSVPISRSEGTYKWTLIVLHRAFAAVHGNPVPERAVVHLHELRAAHVSRFEREFPDSKIILASRDPLISIDRWMKVLGYEQDDPSLPYAVASSCMRHGGWWVDARRVFGAMPPDRVMMTDLGSLHSRGYEGLDRLAMWLGLRPAPSLRFSSLGGVAWGGNSSDGKPRSGLDPTRSPLEDCNSMNTVQAEVVARYFCEVREAVGYSITTHEPVPIAERVRLGASALGWHQHDATQTPLLRRIRRAGSLGQQNLALLPSVVFGTIPFKANPLTGKSGLSWTLQDCFLPMQPV